MEEEENREEKSGVKNVGGGVGAETARQGLSGSHHDSPSPQSAAHSSHK